MPGHNCSSGRCGYCVSCMASRNGGPLGNAGYSSSSSNYGASGSSGYYGSSGNYGTYGPSGTSGYHGSSDPYSDGSQSRAGRADAEAEDAARILLSMRYSDGKGDSKSSYGQGGYGYGK